MPEFTEYVCWDLETSGLDSKNDRILEIGAVHWKGDEIVKQKNWMLKHPGLKVSETITEITGITQELIDAEGIEPKKAIDELLDLLASVQWKNLTHNGFRFDIPFLLEAMIRDSTFDYSEREEVKKLLYKNGYDSAALYKGQQLGMTMKEGEPFMHYAKRVLDTKAYGVRYNVAHCCKDLKVDTANMQMHRALGDVHLTNRIFQKMQGI